MKGKIKHEFFVHREPILELQLHINSGSCTRHQK